jgi:group I intron endonuclease
MQSIRMLLTMQLGEYSYLWRMIHGEISSVNKSGIYMATHIPTGRGYVGSSVNIGKRCRQHLGLSRRGSMTCFHRAIREHGIDEFDWVILEECQQAVLLTREKAWLELHGTASLRGFNTRENPVATYNREYSDATRARIGLKSLGRKHSPETRSKMSAALKGKRFTPEHRAKIGASLKGRFISSEHRAKISATLKQKNQCKTTQK